MAGKSGGVSWGTVAVVVGLLVVAGLVFWVGSTLLGAIQAL